MKEWLYAGMLSVLTDTKILPPPPVLLGGKNPRFGAYMKGRAMMEITGDNRSTRRVYVKAYRTTHRQGT